MKELALKYGCNPNQKPSRIYMDDDRDLPIEVLSGRPGYINFLDAFNGWQLVKELNAQLHGRGGGKPFFAQGSVSASRAAIEAFFRERGE